MTWPQTFFVVWLNLAVPLALTLYRIPVLFLFDPSARPLRRKRVGDLQEETRGEQKRQRRRGGGGGGGGGVKPKQQHAQVVVVATVSRVIVAVSYNHIKGNATSVKRPPYLF